MNLSAKRKWLYFFTLLVFFTGAFMLFSNIREPGRAPAALPAFNPWQEIENKQRKQILSATDILKSDTIYVLQVGDISDSSICTRYKYLKVDFAADGVAVSGNKPTISFTANCEATNNMITLHLPISEIANKPAKQWEFAFTANPNVAVKVEHVIGFWPESWSLHQITFFNTADGQKFTLSKDFIGATQVSFQFNK